MLKLGFVFVAVALFGCSSCADLQTGELDSLTEYSNGNIKDRGSDSKTTGEDDEFKENDEYGDDASSSKQEQGSNRFSFKLILIFRCCCCCCCCW